MTLSRTRWMLLSAASFAAMTLMSAVNAKDELSKPARKVLSEELRLSGSDWNRRQQLGEELVKAKSSAEELRWHADFVKLDHNCPAISRIESTEYGNHFPNPVHF